MNEDKPIMRGAYAFWTDAPDEYLESLIEQHEYLSIIKVKNGGEQLEDKSLRRVGMLVNHEDPNPIMNETVAEIRNQGYRLANYVRLPTDQALVV